MEGWPATREEFRRFGATAKKIYRAEVKLTNSRSFAEVMMTVSHMDCRGGDGRNQEFAQKGKEDREGRCVKDEN